MRQIKELDVRHPYVGEVPAELMAGFDALKIDAEWQWVLTVDGKVTAQMLCCPIHGLLGIVRVTAFPECPSAWMVTFLRKVMADAASQGILGYITFLSDRNPQERKLMRIVQKSGGMLLPSTGAWGFGSTEVRY